MDTKTVNKQPQMHLRGGGLWGGGVGGVQKFNPSYLFIIFNPVS